MLVGIVHTAAGAELVWCGTTSYTRRNRHNQVHHTKSRCPYIMSTSEERDSKKAKTVYKESAMIRYCTGTSVRVARVGVVPRAAAVRRRPYTASKMDDGL